MANWDQKKVVIVDDSEHIRTSLTKLYTEVGMVVIGEAVDGLEALTKVEQLQPDLVSLDVIMPHMNGIDCYRRFAAWPVPPRMLVISSLANDPGFAQKFDGEIPSYLFLGKPVDAKQLTAALDQAFAAPVKERSSDRSPPRALSAGAYKGALN